jgi:zinc and cadmium transporter
MTLIAILLGTVAAGVGSVWLVAALSFAMLARFTTHLRLEAFESQASAPGLFACLLGGLVFFFLLDKAEIWHHGYEYHHGHHHAHGSDTEPAAGRCWLATACTRLATAF